MANKEALRELQSRLAERLQSARIGERSVSWLAVEAAGRGFLLPLAQSGEIFPSLPVQPLPHAQPWFLGVANLRGHLHGVVDLAAFLGVRAAVAQVTEALRDRSQLIALNTTLALNCALWVEQLSGLRHASELTALTDEGPRPAFAGLRYRDAAGREWQALDLAALAADPAFLNIAG
jgi:twitching motility protein PilI